MWAGSRVAFPRPLEIGSAATRHSTIKSVGEKAGRSGHIAFVTVEHVIADEHGSCIVEEPKTFYREARETTAPQASDKGGKGETIGRSNDRPPFPNAPLRSR